MKKIALLLTIGFVITTSLNAGKKNLHRPGLDEFRSFQSKTYKLLTDVQNNFDNSFQSRLISADDSVYLELESKTFVAQIVINHRNFTAESFATFKNSTEFKEGKIPQISIKSCVGSLTSEHILNCLKQEVVAFERAVLDLHYQSEKSKQEEMPVVPSDSLEEATSDLLKAVEDKDFKGFMKP